MEPAGVAYSSVIDRRECSFLDTGTGGCAAFFPNVATVSVSGAVPHPTTVLPSLRPTPPPPPRNHRWDRELEIFEGHCALCGKSLARIDIFFYNDSRFCSKECRKRRSDAEEEAVAAAAATAAAAAVEERLRRERGRHVGVGNGGYIISPLRRLRETKERLGRMWRCTCMHCDQN